MSKLKSLQKSVARARKIVEAAGTTMALTTIAAEKQPVIIKAEFDSAFNLNKLQKELFATGDKDAKVSVAGNTVTIETINPKAAIRILRLLGIDVDMSNVVNLESNMTSNNPATAETTSDDAAAMVAGESVKRRR